MNLGVAQQATPEPKVALGDDRMDITPVALRVLFRIFPAVRDLGRHQKFGFDPGLSRNGLAFPIQQGWHQGLTIEPRQLVSWSYSRGARGRQRQAKTRQTVAQVPRRKTDGQSSRWPSAAALNDARLKDPLFEAIQEHGVCSPIHPESISAGVMEGGRLRNIMTCHIDNFPPIYRYR